MKKRIIMGVILLCGARVMSAADAPPGHEKTWYKSIAGTFGGLYQAGFEKMTPDATLESILGTRNFDEKTDQDKIALVKSALQSLVKKQNDITQDLTRRLNRMKKYATPLKVQDWDYPAIVSRWLMSERPILSNLKSDYVKAIRESISVLQQTLEVIQLETDTAQPAYVGRAVGEDVPPAYTPAAVVPAVMPGDQPPAYTPSLTPSSGGTVTPPGAAASPR